MARRLAKKLHWYRLDLAKHYKETAARYSIRKRCHDIDKQKLVRLVRTTIQQHPEGVIIDSHLAQVLPAAMVGLCIVVQCPNLKKLQRRLVTRGYSTKKVRENLDAEIFQVCLIEALERKHKILKVDVAQPFSLLSLLGNIKQKIFYPR